MTTTTLTASHYADDYEGDAVPSHILDQWNAEEVEAEIDYMYLYMPGPGDGEGDPEDVKWTDPENGDNDCFAIYY
jgi:hypothetical protein